MKRSRTSANDINKAKGHISLSLSGTAILCQRASSDPLWWQICHSSGEQPASVGICSSHFGNAGRTVGGRGGSGVEVKAL